jgi:hypothetical protein
MIDFNKIVEPCQQRMQVFRPVTIVCAWVFIDYRRNFRNGSLDT